MRVIIPSRLNTFTKDYRLPLRATTGLLILLLLLLAIRTYERGVLAGVLGDSNQQNGDYANLINKDKDADLTKNAVEQEKVTTAGATPTTTQNTSLAINSDGGNSAALPPTSPGTPPTGGSSTTPPPTEPAGPFSARLNTFGLNAITGPFFCDHNAPGAGQYCKNYEFIAGISTFNGPGTVAHFLRWEGPESDQVNGSFLAGNGDGLTQVRTVVKLSCDELGLYVFRFKIYEPNDDESHEIPVNHNCGTMAPAPGP